MIKRANRLILLGLGAVLLVPPCSAKSASQDNPRLGPNLYGAPDGDSAPGAIGPACHSDLKNVLKLIKVHIQNNFMSNLTCQVEKSSSQPSGSRCNSICDHCVTVGKYLTPTVVHGYDDSDDHGPDSDAQHLGATDNQSATPFDTDISDATFWKEVQSSAAKTPLHRHLSVVIKIILDDSRLKFYAPKNDKTNSIWAIRNSGSNPTMFYCRSPIRFEGPHKEVAFVTVRARWVESGLGTPNDVLGSLNIGLDLPAGDDMTLPIYIDPIFKGSG